MKRIISYFTNKWRKSEEERLLKTADAIFVAMRNNKLIDDGGALNSITLNHWAEDWYGDGSPAKIEVKWNSAGNSISKNSVIKNFK